MATASDARWTQKGGEKYYGYKDHAKIDTKSKLIDTYEVTNAEVHDSQPTEKLLRDEDKGQELYADSAYIGKPIEYMLQEKGIIPQIIERAFKGKWLTEAGFPPRSKIQIDANEKTLTLRPIV